MIKNGAALCASADDIVRDFENESLGILNPFELAKKASVDMAATLEALRIAAVSVDDNIFRPSHKKAKTTVKNETEESALENSLPKQTKEISFEGFDANAVKIYKKIPPGKDCEIESLIDDEFPLRVVMNSLLKLEMGRFITMLPGEKVRRNF